MVELYTGLGLDSDLINDFIEGEEITDVAMLEGISKILDELVQNRESIKDKFTIDSFKKNLNLVKKNVNALRTKAFQVAN